MDAAVDVGGSVFDVVGRPTANGVSWAWAQRDLEMLTVPTARADLEPLFEGESVPRVVLIYLGAECFVDVRGMRLLLEVARRVRAGGGELLVVAPPWSLCRVIDVLGLRTELPTASSTRAATLWARARSGG